MTRKSGDLTCADCAAPMYAGTGSLPQGKARCRGCRRAANPIRFRPCARCGTRTSRKRFCSSVCRPIRRTCQMCSISYVRTHSEQMTCGRACGGAYRTYTTTGLRTDIACHVDYASCVDCEAVFVWRGQHHCRRPEYTTCKVSIRDCVVCAEPFSTQHTTLTCSPTCAAIKRKQDSRLGKDIRRARQRSAYVAPVYRQRVFEADGWRCHLCHRMVNRTAVVPHPLAPTIDHLVPLAVGGTHEPSNCRTAHFRCNYRKGARAAANGDQLILL